MQLTDTICYILLTISVTASCMQSESQPQEVSLKRMDRRKAKRDAAVIIDNFPVETMASKNPKMIYKKMSKRYRLPKPRYGPVRSKYGAPRTTRNPTVYNKKHKYRKSNTKYGPPTSNKRSPKPKYLPTPHITPQRNKNKYGNPKIKRKPKPNQNIINNNDQVFQEPVGFGEPPTNYASNYGEPPIDSYQAPLNTRLKGPYQTTEDFENANNYDKPEQNIDVWPDLSISDNKQGYSNNYQTLVKPEAALNVFNQKNFEDDQNLNSYFDMYAGKKPNYAQIPKKNPDFMGDFHKLINRPWKAQSQHDQVLVGGQYAEPPGRYVARFQPSAPMNLEDEEEFNPPNSYLDAETSVTVSPYVNYKNSNMAFSPQNLNDAFSIVDKRR